MNKAVRTVLVAAVAVGALAGCAQSPSVAAIVDGTTITEAQVTQAATALEVGAGMPAGEARSTAADVLIKGAIARGLAADNGITVTQAHVDQYVASQAALVSLAAQPGGDKLVSSLAELRAVTQSLSSDALMAQLPKHQVVLNPRYGVWDSASATIDGTGTLATLVPRKA